MAAIAINQGDHAEFPIPSNSPVSAQCLTYATAQDAADVVTSWNTSSGPTWDMPLPDGQVKPLTRGQVLYLQAVGRAILVLLHPAAGIYYHFNP